MPQLSVPVWPDLLPEMNQLVKKSFETVDCYLENCPNVSRPPYNLIVSQLGQLIYIVPDSVPNLDAARLMIAGKILATTNNFHIVSDKKQSKVLHISVEVLLLDENSIKITALKLRNILRAFFEEKFNKTWEMLCVDSFSNKIQLLRNSITEDVKILINKNLLTKQKTSNTKKQKLLFLFAPISRRIVAGTSKSANVVSLSVSSLNNCNGIDEKLKKRKVIKKLNKLTNVSNTTTVSNLESISNESRNKNNNNTSQSENFATKTKKLNLFEVASPKINKNEFKLKNKSFCNEEFVDKVTQIFTRKRRNSCGDEIKSTCEMQNYSNVLNMNEIDKNNKIFSSFVEISYQELMDTEKKLENNDNFNSLYQENKFNNDLYQVSNNFTNNVCLNLINKEQKLNDDNIVNETTKNYSEILKLNLQKVEENYEISNNINEHLNKDSNNFFQKFESNLFNSKRNLEGIEKDINNFTVNFDLHLLTNEVFNEENNQLNDDLINENNQVTKKQLLINKKNLLEDTSNNNVEINGDKNSESNNDVKIFDLKLSQTEENFMNSNEVNKSAVKKENNVLQKCELDLINSKKNTTKIDDNNDFLIENASLTVQNKNSSVKDEIKTNGIIKDIKKDVSQNFETNSLTFKKNLKNSATVAEKLKNDKANLQEKSKFDEMGSQIILQKNYCETTHSTESLNLNLFNDKQKLKTKVRATSDAQEEENSASEISELSILNAEESFKSIDDAVNDCEKENRRLPNLECNLVNTKKTLENSYTDMVDNTINNNLNLNYLKNERKINEIKYENKTNETNNDFLHSSDLCLEEIFDNKVKLNNNSDKVVNNFPNLSHTNFDSKKKDDQDNNNNYFSDYEIVNLSKNTSLNLINAATESEINKNNENTNNLDVEQLEENVNCENLLNTNNHKIDTKDNCFKDIDNTNFNNTTKSLKNNDLTEIVEDYKPISISEFLSKQSSYSFNYFSNNSDSLNSNENKESYKNLSINTLADTFTTSTLTAQLSNKNLLVCSDKSSQSLISTHELTSVLTNNNIISTDQTFLFNTSNQSNSNSNLLEEDNYKRKRFRIEEDEEDTLLLSYQSTTTNDNNENSLSTKYRSNEEDDSEALGNLSLRDELSYSSTKSENLYKNTISSNQNKLLNNRLYFLNQNKPSLYSNTIKNYDINVNLLGTTKIIANNLKLKKFTSVATKSKVCGSINQMPVTILQQVLSYFSYNELCNLRRVHPHWDELCGQMLNSGYYRLIKVADFLLTDCQRRVYKEKYLTKPIRVLTNLQVYVINPVDVLRAAIDEGVICFPYGLILDKAFELLKRIKFVIKEKKEINDFLLNWECIAKFSRQAQIHYRNVIEPEAERRMTDVYKLSAVQRLQRLDSFFVERTVSKIEKETEKAKDDMRWEIEQLKNQNQQLKKDNRELKQTCLKFDTRIEVLERKFKTMARLLQ